MELLWSYCYIEGYGYVEVDFLKFFDICEYVWCLMNDFFKLN